VHADHRAITRGTTNPNRLRRYDRWLAGPQAWRLRRSAAAPIVVDLGYGASPVTAVELHDRLRRVRPDVRVVGIEIDPARVAAAAPLAREGLEFLVGGFEVPLPDGAPVTVIRACNVLRQYDENDVAGAWSRLLGRLTPDGIVVDGTCDELGRVATWVCLDRDGPRSLTLSLRLAGLASPAVLAERLPKVLIHRNVPGEPVHAFLTAVEQSWAYAAAHAAYGMRARFVATATRLAADGWPLTDGRSRWRLGELTVDWSAVAPGPVPR
jgi:SAM-dependent methyltransferase